MPTFSVIIPTYNRAHLLPRCLDSVLAQRLTDFEIVVADDGSTDGTRSLVRQYAEKDKRIKYAYQRNQGANVARNLGAGQAEGMYLTFLDSDDEALPHWLEAMHGVARAAHAEAVCCGIRFVGPSGELKSEKLPKSGDPTSYPRGLYLSGTYCVRRDVFFLLDGFHPPLRANQHSEFRCRLLPKVRTHGWAVGLVHEVLVHAHDHDGAKIRGNIRDVFESAVYVLTEHAHVLKENPSTYFSWASAAGGAAAQLGRYGDARTWFFAAIRTRPASIRGIARCLLTFVPGLRSYVWRRTEGTTEDGSP